MKKLLILLALAACAACNTEDDNDNRQKATFGGTLTITSNQTPSATPFVTNNISFELTEDNSGLFKLTMYNVRFAQSMPMSLNIVIPELKYEDSDNDGIYELTSTADPIIPYIGGKPYYDPQTGKGFAIPMFTAAGSPTAAWQVIFTCRNAQIPVGDETLDHKAVYKGTILL